MKPGRWIAVGVCGGLVAIGTGLLYLALSGDVDGTSSLRFFPYFALLAWIAAPFAAAALSSSTTPLVAGAGGLALGIAAAVVTAGLRAGNTGVVPVTLGIAVGGIVGLRADSRTAIWLRVAAAVLLAVYAAVSQRLVTIVFVYPVLGFADEFADAIGSRRRRPKGDDRDGARVTTS